MKDITITAEEPPELEAVDIAAKLFSAVDNPGENGKLAKKKPVLPAVRRVGANAGTMWSNCPYQPTASRFITIYIV